jgi:hypothetical protein
MQPTEDRLSPDFTSLGQSMPIHRSRPGQGLILVIHMLIRWILDQSTFITAKLAWVAAKSSLRRPIPTVKP